MATGIGLHNFPTGFAFGASSDLLANSMLMTMVLHTIPEGIAIFVPLFAAAYSARIILPHPATRILYKELLTLPIYPIINNKIA